MVSRAFAVVGYEEHALTRLKRQAQLEPNDIERITKAATYARLYRAGSELAREGGESVRPSLLLSGWLAHQRTLPDGRCQIVGLTLPGEIFGRHWSGQDRALTNQTALTDILVCPFPVAPEGTPLREAYYKQLLLRRLQLVDHAVRLGRMNAKERVCDFLLEIMERLRLSGETKDNCFDMPLTQECLADALGLTPVHLNRTVQACRRDGLFLWKRGRISIQDPADLADMLGRKQTETWLHPLPCPPSQAG